MPYDAACAMKHADVRIDVASRIRESALKRDIMVMRASEEI